MKMTRKLLLVFFCIALLTGCWDQKLLKDTKLIMTSGLDVFYRDPKRSLVANVAVVKGRAVDLLNLKLNEKGNISGIHIVLSHLQQ